MNESGIWKAFFLAVVFVFISANSVFCQTGEAELRKEIAALKEELRLLQIDHSDLKTIMIKLMSAQLLAAQQNPQPAPSIPSQPQQQPPQVSVAGVTFDIGDNPVMGSESSKLILIEFTDYQCPFCGRYARETFPELRKQYVDTGQMRYSVIDQPLPMHTEAAKAAEAAHCAKDQGKFWEIHDAMMANQDDLKDLSSYAKKLNLNIGVFETCLNTGKYKDTVNRNIKLAIELGITGVPGFILGTINENDPRKVTGITVIRGAIPLESFRQGLDIVLKNK